MKCNHAASMWENNYISARRLDNLEKEYKVSVYFLRRYLALFQSASRLHVLVTFAVTVASFTGLKHRNCDVY